MCKVLPCIFNKDEQFVKWKAAFLCFFLVCLFWFVHLSVTCFKAEITAQLHSWRRSRSWLSTHPEKRPKATFNSCKSWLYPTDLDAHTHTGVTCPFITMNMSTAGNFKSLPAVKIHMLHTADTQLCFLRWSLKTTVQRQELRFLWSLYSERDT